MKQEHEAGVRASLPDAKEDTTPEIPPVGPPRQPEFVLLTEGQNCTCGANEALLMAA